MKPQTLPRVNYGKLSHEQLLSMAQRIVSSWNGRDVIPPTTKLLLAKLAPLMESLDKILRRDQASELTDKVNNTDELRDRAYRLLISKINNALNEFDTTVVEAAESLMPVVTKFGRDITGMAQAEESTKLNQAISEFRQSRNLEALTTLSFVPDLDRVEQYNNDFVTVLNERLALESSKEELPLLRPVRREIEHSMRLLTSVSEFLYSEKHVSVDKELYDLFNEELTNASALVKMRDTRSELAE